MPKVIKMKDISDSFTIKKNMLICVFLLIYVTQALNLTIHFVPHSHDDLGW